MFTPFYREQYRTLCDSPHLDINTWTRLVGSKIWPSELIYNPTNVRVMLRKGAPTLMRVSNQEDWYQDLCAGVKKALGLRVGDSLELCTVEGTPVKNMEGGFLDLHRVGTLYPHKRGVRCYRKPTSPDDCVFVGARYAVDRDEKLRGWVDSLSKNVCYTVAKEMVDDDLVTLNARFRPGSSKSLKPVIQRVVDATKLPSHIQGSEDYRGLKNVVAIHGDKGVRAAHVGAAVAGLIHDEIKKAFIAHRNKIKDYHAIRELDAMNAQQADGDVFTAAPSGGFQELQRRYHSPEELYRDVLNPAMTKNMALTQKIATMIRKGPIDPVATKLLQTPEGEPAAVESPVSSTIFQQRLSPTQFKEAQRLARQMCGKIEHPGVVSRKELESQQKRLAERAYQKEIAESLELVECHGRYKKKDEEDEDEGISQRIAPGVLPIGSLANEEGDLPSLIPVGGSATGDLPSLVPIGGSATGDLPSLVPIAESAPQLDPYVSPKKKSGLPSLSGFKQKYQGNASMLAIAEKLWKSQPLRNTSSTRGLILVPLESYRLADMEANPKAHLPSYYSSRVNRAGNSMSFKTADGRRHSIKGKVHYVDGKRMVKPLVSIEERMIAGHPFIVITQAEEY